MIQKKTCPNCSAKAALEVNSCSNCGYQFSPNSIVRIKADELKNFTSKSFYEMATGKPAFSYPSLHDEMNILNYKLDDILNQLKKLTHHKPE